MTLCLQEGTYIFDSRDLQPRSGKRSVAHGVSHGIAWKTSLSRSAAEHFPIEFRRCRGWLLLPTDTHGLRRGLQNFRPLRGLAESTM